MNFKHTLLLGVLSLSLFSCNKEADDIEEGVSENNPNAVTEQFRASPCGNAIKPVWFIVWHEDYDEDIKLRYFGYDNSEVDVFYPDYADGEARYRAKRGVEPHDVVVHFNEDERPGFEGRMRRDAYMASYGGSDGARKYHYCLVDESINRRDQRIGKQYPVWGSCSGRFFVKNISSILD